MTQIIDWKGQETLEHIDAELAEGRPVAVRNMPHDIYHQHKSASSSFLRDLLARCPSKAYLKSPFNPERKPQDYKKHFSIGTAAHDMLLQRDRFYDQNSVLPANFNGRTNEGKALKADILAEGKNPVTTDDYETVKKMVKAVDAHPFAGGAFMDGEPEIALFWIDELTKLPCRCKPDFLTNDKLNVPDYKTTKDASPDGIEKSMNQFGYHMQNPWYARGIKAVFGIKPQRFFYVYQEAEEPYVVTCSVPGENAIRFGDMLNRKALNILAECLESGNWPGYSDDVIISHLPRWAEMRLDEMEQNGELPDVEPF